METFISLEDIESYELKAPAKTYDIQVEENHNYFLSGNILVHNSGKTYSIIQFLAYYLLQKSGVTITIGRETLTDIKDTILPDLFEVFQDFGIMRRSDYKWNKSEKHITFNGNLIRYIGVNDNPNKTHGLKQNVFWLNEIMPINKFTFDQLEQRTTDFWIMDYNPSSTKHWAYDVADKRDDVLLFKSTMLNNPVLGANEKKKLNSYEPTEQNKLLGTADEFMWQVYGLGMRVNADTIIFGNYQTFDIAPAEYDYKFYGLDFGFSQDPTACVEVIISGKNLFITELVYETGLLNEHIANRIKDIVKDDFLFCDSAEPKSIADLRINHDLTAVPAKKGAGSIVEGIKIIKGFKVHLNKNSLNLIDEFDNYKFIEKAGKMIPEDKNNHLIDAIRYSLATYR